MKKITTLTLLVYCIVIATNIFSQTAINTSGNYTDMYDFANQYFNNPNYQPSNNEGGTDEYIKKTMRLWGNSLHPTGDFSVAAQAITNYASGYSFQASSYNPNWTSLGPSEDPFGPQSGVGQIHRLEFDPNYDGITNQTIYAGTGYGGLWKTIDNGLNWTSMNTDVQLPITSVSGIAVNPNNTSNIFISTGDGDGGFGLRFSNNHGFANPVSTVGVYRTTDNGLNWENINNGLLANFSQSGIIREMRMNPSNPDEIILASSAGVIKTTNATSVTPTWNVEFTGTDPLNPDQQFRGIEYKPNDPNIIYASGTDIYKYDGVSWASMTGVGTGLDFSTLPNAYTPSRINIAVTPADPNMLYAYIYGVETNNTDKIYIYVFKNNSWSKIYEAYGSGINNISITWLPIAVSPVNANEYYFGFTKVYGTSDYTTIQELDMSGYTTSGFHADVHALKFCPNMANPDLFAGTHGGVNYLSVPSTPNQIQRWQRRYKGLPVSLIWAFDNSEFDERKIIGKQDLGISILNPTTSSWQTITGGDGYGTRIDDEYPDEVYFTGNFAFQKYNFFLGSIYQTENNYLPTDFFEQVKASVPQTFPMVNHPESGELWFGFSELYKRKKREIVSGDTETDIWEVESGNHTIPNHSARWQRGISELAIAESNPNYIYVVTTGVDNGGASSWNLDPLLLRSTTGGTLGNPTGTNFVDITSNLPNIYGGATDYPVITSIAVNPSDENELWVTFAGYDPSLKVWHSTDAGNTWSNYDPNGVLPNLSVNSIVYQDGTDDILYIGTDVGVYVKNGNSNDWEKYGDFPNVRVTEMKINGCSAKLDVATYGRGLWEGDLLPSGSYTGGRIITSNETWSGDKSVKTNLIIPNGATLTILGTVNMPKNGKIIIEKGGKLIIDGGIVTNKCGNMWRGIEVRGDMNASQVIAGSQGVAEFKNGALIENCYSIHASEHDLNENYIWGTFGGIIRASNSTFKNIRSGIEFGPYQNFNPFNPSVKLNDLSHILNNEFIWDGNGNMVLNGVNPYSFIGMWDSHGIRIRGNTFKNDAPYTTYDGMNRGIAIVSFDSEYRVEGLCNSLTFPCTSYDQNSFTNLTYGIKASASNSFHSIFVDGADFINCQRGILLKDIDYAAITNNTFDVASPVSPVTTNYTYGIYMDNCNGYEVEENTISSSVTTPPNSRPTYGIYVYNSGQNDNEIYKNVCENVAVGIQSSNVNGNGDQFNPIGLEYRCNDMNNNFNASLSITDVLTKPFQGTCNSASTAANNSFDFSAAYDVWTNPSLPFVGYRYSNDPGAIYGVEPRNPPNTNNNLFKNVCFTPYTPNTSCPSHQTSTVPILLNQYSTLKTAATNTLNVIDNGDTDYLLSIINTAPDWQVRNELLNASPYLSNKVLLNMLAKTPALPDWVIEQVLSANTPLNDEIFLAVLERSPALPDYLINNIAQSSTPLSTKEQLALIYRTPTLPDWVLNQIMIDNSPLFDEVLFALIDKVPTIPDWSIRNIFMQNTPLSENVQYSLNNHYPSYPNWVLNAINNSPYIAGEPLEEPQPSSPIMEMKQEAAEFNRQATLTKNELFRTYLHDTTGTYGIDDVIQFIKNEEKCQTKEHCDLTKAYICKGDLTKAQNQIDSLIQDTSLAIFCELNGTLIELQQSNTTLSTNSAAKQSVESIAQLSNASKEKSAAEAMLAFENFLVYQEIFEPIIPTGSSNRVAQPNTVVLTDEDYVFNTVDIYPNPATYSFTVDYNLSTNKETTFRLYDISGKEVMKKIITDVVGKQTYSTYGLKSGIYFYSVIIDEATIIRDKLIITNQ